jgi:4-hydroxy-tetrahydrodipicolinate synthase
MTTLIHECLVGRYPEALLLHRKLFDLMKANFIETNPIPVKAGLAMMGFIEERYRLPLVPMSKDNKERLRRVMLDLDLIEQ